ncbi:MAG: hypothetical protein IH812_02880 [Proteobacteria bacterium]|nr:hypothetical protein [Pseudomonadota bacterium]
MKSRLMAALAVLLCASMFSVPAAAQDNDRNWENGNVIATTQVFTDPGMFNAYINDLRGLWRVFLDQQIEDGNVVSYRMLVNSFARDGEPDLLLITEHPNWAAFDLSSEYFDALTEKLQGSLAKARDATIERGKLRRLGGNAVYQEIKFKD